MQDGDEPRSYLVNNVIESKSEKCVVEMGPDVTDHLVKTAEPITTLHDYKVDEGKVVATGGDLCVNVSDQEPPCHPKQFDQLRVDQSEIFVCIKYAKMKHKVQLTRPCSSLDAFKAFSRAIRVPVEKLKVIHKGKLQTEANITENLKDNAVFFAMGEMTEIEDGLNPMDIEIIMKQLSVDRNVAIKALRKTGCLLDAIFEVGNDI